MAGIQVVALRRPNEDEMEENSWRSRREELRPVAGGRLMIAGSIDYMG
jgi:hypothetical protein